MFILFIFLILTKEEYLLIEGICNFNYNKNIYNLTLETNEYNKINEEICKCDFNDIIIHISECNNNYHHIYYSWKDEKRCKNGINLPKNTTVECFNNLYSNVYYYIFGSIVLIIILINIIICILYRNKLYKSKDIIIEYVITCIFY